ncbi:MAG: hypothetical protein P8X42_08615 [Calditrichaceae bacterium]
MSLDYFFSRNIDDLNIPVLRFYGWKPYCLSLGRHQSAADVDFDKLFSAGYEAVRRPTGGSAIFHSEELTYSIVISKKLIDNKELYMLIHQLLFVVLTKMGYNVNLHAENEKTNYLKNGNATFICFNRSAYTEIKADNKKLVGSAQKLYPETILQHGSILIGSGQNDIVNFFNFGQKSQQNYLNYLLDNSIYLNMMTGNRITANNLSQKIIKDIGKFVEIVEKPLSDSEINGAEKYFSDFDLKKLN